MEFFHRPRQLAGIWRAEASSFVVVVSMISSDADIGSREMAQVWV